MTQYPEGGEPQYGSTPPSGGYGAGGASAGGAPPPNYLVQAILTTIFCCLPLGVVSIVFAAQVNGKYAAGDYAGAQDSSQKARRFAFWALIGGIVYVVGVILLFTTGAILGNSGSSS